MTDPELDQLARALIAATDRLNSPDFQDRQSRYIRDELALRELAEGLEVDERAVELAQHDLTQYVAANYLEGADMREPEPAATDWPEYAGNQTRYFQEMADSKLNPPIEPLPTEEDEYATAKAPFTQN